MVKGQFHHYTISMNNNMNLGGRIRFFLMGFIATQLKNNNELYLSMCCQIPFIMQNLEIKF
jgi:uncharacterized membrane protein